MNYTFRGRLCGYICEECSEPLSRVKVRLYRSRSEQNVTALAVAAPKDTFVVLTDEEAQAKASSLIAEVETDDSGQFVFELGEKQRYNGEAFEVDVYCGTVPHRPPGRKEPTPLQFSITTLHPMWRETDEGFVAGWDYCISQRYWCWILHKFDLWVICGRVVVCGTQTPIPGVKVSAFDVDWLQDDPLGTALTDANGRFHIYYVSSTFKKGTFSNIELVGGPDIYFKIATTGGIPLLNEDPSRGRKPDRENRGNCFCVELCLDKDVVPPPTDIPPSFTHVGVVNIQTQIDSGTGLTIGDHRAFYSTLRLYGTVPKKLNGNQTEYMFDVAEYSPANVLGAAVQIQPAQIARTVIGQRLVLTGNIMNPVQVDDWTVNGGPGELKADFTGDGWIKVPQDSNFYPNTGPQPALIRLISESLAAFGTVNQAGIHAGSSSTPLAKDRHFQIRMWVRESGNPGSEIIAGTCVRIAIDNTLYDNVTHGGSWAPQSVSGQLGVSMVDIKELVGNGCGGIGQTLTVLYTSAHPNLGSVSLSMNGPGGPYGFTLSPDAGATPENQFGTAMLTPPALAKNLTPCAYIVTLSTQVLLTNGDAGPGPLDDVIGFCKK
jgi:hypothetical protein